MEFKLQISITKVENGFIIESTPINYGAYVGSTKLFIASSDYDIKNIVSQEVKNIKEYSEQIYEEELQEKRDKSNLKVEEELPSETYLEKENDDLSF